MYEKLTELIATGDYKEALYEFQEEFLHIDEREPKDAAKLCLLEASLWEALDDSTSEYDAIARGIAYDGGNYELFYMLGLYYADINANQSYLAFETALSYCDDEGDREIIQSAIDRLKENPAFGVRKLSIMILSHNDLDLLKRCIESVEKHVPKGAYEIVVVDNASTEEGVLDYLKQKEKSVDYKFKLILNDENSGFPKGCNIGTLCCDKENDIFYLNNDAVLTQNAVFFLRLGLYESRNVGAVSALSNSASLQEVSAEELSKYAKEPLEELWHRRLGPDKSIEIFENYAKDHAYPMKKAYIKRFRLTGYALMMSHDAVKVMSVDGKVFDERFSPGYFEDDDLGIRLARAGFEQYVCKNAFIYHNGGTGFADCKDALEESRNKFIDKWGFDIWGYSLPWFEAADAVIDLYAHKKQGLRIVDFTCGFGANASYIKSSCSDTFIAGVCGNSFEAGIAGLIADDVAYGDVNTMRLPWADRSFDIVIAERKHVSMGQIMRYLKADGLFLSEKLDEKEDTLLDIVKSNADAGFDSAKMDKLLGE
ncbi:MAG: glycosyltransferase [Butyrivibrio sp.]|nr:glycosyltransferase [Butyrivibrio sp.]